MDQHSCSKETQPVLEPSAFIRTLTPPPQPCPSPGLHQFPHTVVKQSPTGSPPFSAVHILCAARMPGHVSLVVDFSYCFPPLP